MKSVVNMLLLYALGDAEAACLWCFKIDTLLWSSPHVMAVGSTEHISHMRSCARFVLTVLSTWVLFTGTCTATRAACCWYLHSWCTKHVPTAFGFYNNCATPAALPHLQESMVQKAWLLTPRNLCTCRHCRTIRCYGTSSNSWTCTLKCCIPPARPATAAVAGALHCLLERPWLLQSTLVTPWVYPE